MPNKPSDTVTYVHNDACASDLDAPTNYRVDIDANWTGEEITNSGTDATISHPIGDTDELRRRAHITAQLAAHNRDQWDDEESAEAFDAAVLDVADRQFRAVGKDISEFPIERSYAYALLIHDAWQFGSIITLIDHLGDHSATVERIGFSSVPSSTSFYRRCKELRDADLRSTITDVSECAVHAVWRPGRYIPTEVQEGWGLNAAADVTEETIPSKTREEALRNWARLLLAESSEALTFDRESTHTSYEVEQFVGLLAHSALQNIGITRASNTAEWIYDDANVPGGDGLLKHIKSLSVDDIESQFEQAHNQVFDRFASHGLLDEPLDFAFDTTEIIWWGKNTDQTVGKRRPETDATAKWVFALLTGFNNDTRVHFGVRHVKSKDLHADVLEELLSIAVANAEPRYLLADKEFYQSGVIETARKYIGKKWIIKAQEYNTVTEFINATPADTQGFQRNIDVTNVTPSPNAFAIPGRVHRKQTLFDYYADHTLSNDQSDQQTLINTQTDTVDDERDSDNDTHTVYLTDMDDEGTTAEIVNFRYDMRWTVETGVSQFKNDAQPACYSKDVRARIYCANIATLFLNWHALINQALSPTYKIPLTVTHHEILTAIRDVAFTDAGTEE